MEGKEAEVFRGPAWRETERSKGSQEDPQYSAPGVCILSAFLGGSYLSQTYAVNQNGEENMSL